MVGEVGRRAPRTSCRVAVVDEDRVAPPVVQDLVRVGRVEDEREADDLRAEQREGRHPVARLPEVLDQRELAVRVRADQAAVHLEVLRRRREVLRGERRRPARAGRPASRPRPAAVAVNACSGPPTT
ncbi:MAG: hypothetical protein MZV64_42430 [Ignavibacteriales bacterium]|nr:hypothetical protein [Ignavibacteriales bacterium]